jgi:AraC-like DNA-binding protein
MAAGRAKLAIGQGVSVWVLEAPDGFGDAHVHVHHAIQITVCLSGELALSDDHMTISAPAIAVAADAPHRFEAHGLLVFIFVEPESRAGRALHVKLFANAALATLDAAELLPVLQPLGDTFAAGRSIEQLVAVGREAVDTLVPDGPARGADPRIQRVIDYAAAHLDQPLTLASASAGIHLSPSRLRHLFVEQTGLAFKTYILWLRLVRALQVYSEGASSLTEAAHAAGFADSAHFSRTFRRTFGLPATTLERF